MAQHQGIKAKLLARRVGTDTVEIDGVGTVTVRGLTRNESIMVANEKHLGKRDQVMLSLGMVDPPMTAADVAEWSAAAPGGEIEDVSRKIAELSKMTEAAPKGDV